MQPWVEERGDCIRLCNEQIELGFSRSDGGGLVALVDKQSGCELRRDTAAPVTLYRLGLRRQAGHELEWLDSRDAARFQWHSEGDEHDIVTLSLLSSGFGGRGATVVVTVSLAAGSPLSVWHMRVEGLEPDLAVAQLTCPIVTGLVKLGDPAPGEALAVPVQGEGYLFRDPYRVVDRLPLCAGPGPESPRVGVGAWRGLYPGQVPMQMAAFYNDAAGVYFAAHDAGQHVKAFQMACRDAWGPGPVLSMTHFPGEAVGADVAISYDVIVGVFHGDWMDAADIYKAWATRQWWCAKKLWDRDIADWMRGGFGVFQMSNYHIPKLKLNHSLTQIADVVNDQASQAGVPLLALVFNWEGGGAWTGPTGFFPPREGETAFSDAMARLREAGNHGFVYVTGGCWYLKLPYDPPFDSWETFEAEARPHAVKTIDGQVPVGRWYAGWESTRICVATEFTRERTASVVMGCLKLGATVVQIDNFPCGGAEACYDATHGHPLGYGPWWAKAWGELLADVRRRAKRENPEAALTTEGISESFIPYLDMYDHRAGNMEYFGHYSPGHPAGGETIPLFNYVYNEYIGSYCAAMPECNRPEVLYWTRCFGKALCQGVAPTGGWYMPEPAALNPTTVGFYRKVVRAAAQECWPYLMFGAMLRPPRIDVPTITASYCKFVLTETEHAVDPTQRHEVRDRAVECAAWRGRDGSICAVFVNVSEDAVGFDVEVTAYGTEADVFDVERITDGAREPWLRAVALPRREWLEMAPLSVLVLVVRAGANA